MKKKVAIVYHYLAHYRLPVFKELMRSEIIDYTLISDRNSNNNIKTIDPRLAQLNIQKGGLRWIFIKNRWFFKKLLWQFGLITELRKGKFDSVIFLGDAYFLSTWIAAVYLRILNRKFYFWSHGVTNKKKGIKWFLRSIFYNLSDGILLYGNNAKKVMNTNGFALRKLHVIYNSLDYRTQLKLRSEFDETIFYNYRTKLFKYPNLPLIVFVGRLTTQKQLKLIIEASKYLHDNSYKINTLFIGDGEAKNDLENLVLKYELKDFFKFYGPCYEESLLAKLIGSSDICVSPGEVGLTAMTSLGYGTPVITHDDFNYQMPEFEAIIPGVNGHLFKKGSVKDLALCIKKWMVYANTKSRPQIREQCYEIIDSTYNPINQARIINSILLTNE